MMGFSKLESAFVIGFVSLTLMQLSHAQHTPQEFLDAHNSGRAQVGVGPITWDTAVASYAQHYANHRDSNCTLVQSGGPYGENLAGSPGYITSTTAVNSWVSEKPNYDYPTNTCATGKVCRHYTQVVWRNSIRLGCARVTCGNGGTFVICSYGPPWNIIGQRPY